MDRQNLLRSVGSSSMSVACSDGKAAKLHCPKIVKQNVAIITDNFVILRYAQSSKPANNGKMYTRIAYV